MAISLYHDPVCGFGDHEQNKKMSVEGRQVAIRRNGTLIFIQPKTSLTQGEAWGQQVSF